MNLRFIDDKSTQLVLFDMDGVVAEFVSGEESLIQKEVPNVYLNKRPLKSVISIAEKLHEKENVTVGILSSCEFFSQIKEKKEWLAKYMPFVDESNIYIIVWADGKYSRDERKFAKVDVIKKISGYEKIFLIDDKHDVIKVTNKELPNVAHHVSELIF